MFKNLANHFSINLVRHYQPASLEPPTLFGLKAGQEFKRMAGAILEGY